MTGAGVMTGLATEVSNPKKKKGARQKSFALIYNQGICPRMCIRADELERAKQKQFIKIKSFHSPIRSTYTSNTR